MSVPELVPDNRVLFLAIEISLMLLHLIAARSSERSESSSGQLIQPPTPKGCTAEGTRGAKRQPLQAMASRCLDTAD